MDVSREQSRQRTKIIVISVIIAAVLIGAAASFPFLHETTKPPQTKNPDFALALSPGALTFQQNAEKAQYVRVIVEPLHGFTEEVTFSLGGVFAQEEVSKNSIHAGIAGIQAAFVTPTVTSSRYQEGIVLYVRIDGTVQRGEYNFILHANSSSLEKDFVLPLIVE